MTNFYGYLKFLLISIFAFSAFWSVGKFLIQPAEVSVTKMNNIGNTNFNIFLKCIDLIEKSYDFFFFLVLFLSNDNSCLLPQTANWQDQVAHSEGGSHTRAWGVDMGPPPPPNYMA